MDLERIGDISRYPKLLPPNPDHIWCIWCWKNIEKALLPRCEYLVCCNLRHSEPVMCMLGTVYSCIFCVVLRWNLICYRLIPPQMKRFNSIRQDATSSILVNHCCFTGPFWYRFGPRVTPEHRQLRALWIICLELNESCFHRSKSKCNQLSELAWHSVECTAPPYRLNFPLALSPYGLRMVHGLMGWFSGCSPFPVTWAAWAPSSKHRASRTIRRSFFRCFSP